MRTYQWNAADYAKSSSTQLLWARELIGKLDVKGTERLLDIGSGKGKVTAEIAGCLSNGSILGIDSSKEMVAFARRTYPVDAFPNLRFQQGDARSLPFRNEFDIIFSNAVLHWVLNHRAVVRGIFSGLKPGGKILLQMGGKGNAGDVIQAFDSLKKKSQWSGCFDGFSFPYGFYSTEEYREWLCEAGLHPARVELIHKNAVHEDRIAFEAWIRTTWLPYTQRVPEKKRDIFVVQLADAYLNGHPPDEQGKVHVSMVRLEVEAYKP